MGIRAVRPAIYIVALGLIAWVFTLAEPYAGMALTPTLWFGLLATSALFLALLPGPLYAVAPRLPGKTLWIHARRALGISSAVFTGLHAHYGFNGFVGGFEGLEFWSWDYNLSLLLGLIALVILAVLALTSFDRVVAAMGRGWKRLHRLVYLASLLTLVHVVSVTIRVLWRQLLVVLLDQPPPPLSPLRLGPGG